MLIFAPKLFMTRVRSSHSVIAWLCGGCKLEIVSKAMAVRDFIG
ncbi:hypothetical protein SynROS8604_02495 [Synechococcus sp. ROS8604]|nr:hypothetical protein SynROS8604_02495 [Synechococcus sp. ROS8604]